MKSMLPGVLGLGVVLTSCAGTPPPVKTFLGMKPDLRTNYIDIATDRYVACDLAFGTTPLRQNIAIVEFSAPTATQANIELIGEKTRETAYALISDLRTSSRGNFLADYVISDRLVPALVVAPQYQYVSLTSRPRGSFRAEVSIDTPNGREKATTGSVNVYESCAFLNNAESQD